MTDKKHFNNTIPHRCEYCENGRAIDGGAEVFCRKKGIMEPEDRCRSFKYDPLKRTPHVQDFGRDYKAEDFKL